MIQKGGETNLKFKAIKITAVALILLFCAASAKSAWAAALYFSPSFGSQKVGSTFSVSIFVSSTNEAMNAASGTVYYSADKLELVSLSKSGSIFSLWITEPSFSQAAGTLRFEGIVMNPGFTGPSGKIITATFKVKAIGSAQVRFSSGSILANNGIGTNILDSLGTANFNLVTETLTPAETPVKVEAPKPVSKPVTSTVTVPAKPVTPPVAPLAAATGLPPAPIISSVTHPNQDDWYNAKQAIFNWALPPDVTAVSLLLGQIDTAVPTVVYSPPINTKTIGDLTDGLWYFSVRFKNRLGWGETAHYRLQVDTTSPDAFAINFVSGGQEIIGLRPMVTFETTDALSKVDHYKIMVIGDAGIEGADEVVKNNPYILPIQSPGKKTLFVQAFDKAGNYAVALADFEVQGFMAPTIISHPQELTEDQQLSVTGQTEPNSEVMVWLKSETDNLKLGKTVMSDAGGHFVFIYDKGLIPGVYKLWAEAKNQQGERSYPSIEYSFKINASTVVKILPWTYSLMIILAVLGWSGFIISLVWYYRYKRVLARKAIELRAQEKINRRVTKNLPAAEKIIKAGAARSGKLILQKNNPSGLPANDE